MLITALIMWGGCSHGCRYPCYAMMMKKRCGIIKGYEEWIRPKIVANTLELPDKVTAKKEGEDKRLGIVEIKKTVSCLSAGLPYHV